MKFETFFIEGIGTYRFKITEENDKHVTFVIVECPDKIKDDIGKTKTVPKLVYESIRKDFLT